MTDYVPLLAAARELTAAYEAGADLAEPVAKLRRAATADGRHDLIPPLRVSAYLAWLNERSALDPAHLARLERAVSDFYDDDRAIRALGGLVAQTIPQLPMAIAMPLYCQGVQGGWAYAAGGFYEGDGES